MAKPAPSLPSRFSRGTRQSSKTQLGVAGPVVAGVAHAGMLRTRRKPGVSVGTMIMLARRWGSASGSVTAITIANCEPSAAEANHLRPLMTYSSPSRTAVVPIQTGFEPG